MGNRGTTRSWDEEEIAKWGFFGHMANVRRGLHRQEGTAKKQELRKLLNLLRAVLAQKESLTVDFVGDCGICQKPLIYVHPDEIRRYDDKPVHEDCYFEKLGELIENHPITSPRHR